MKRIRNFTPSLSTILSLLIAVLCLVLAFSNPPKTSTAEGATPLRSGTATWYGPGYYNHTFACGGQYHYQTRAVAVNARFAACGTRFRLTYHGRSIIVVVRDRCPGCDTSSHPFDLTAQSDRDLLGCRSCRPYTLHGVKYQVVG